MAPRRQVLKQIFVYDHKLDLLQLQREKFGMALDLLQLQIE